MAARDWWQGVNLGLAVTILVSAAVSLFIVGLSADASREQAQLDRRRAAYADLVATSSECTSDSRYAALRLAVDLIVNDEGTVPPNERFDSLWASSFDVQGECQGDMDGAVARMMIDAAPTDVLLAAGRLANITAIEMATNRHDVMEGTDISNAVDEINGSTTTTTTEPGDDAAEAPADLQNARIEFTAMALLDQPPSTVDVWRDRFPDVVVLAVILLLPLAGWRLDRRAAAKRAGTPPPAP
jgi:hypothetical protein